MWVTPLNKGIFLWIHEGIWLEVVDTPIANKDLELYMVTVRVVSGDSSVLHEWGLKVGSIETWVHLDETRFVHSKIIGIFHHLPTGLEEDFFGKQAG